MKKLLFYKLALLGFVGTILVANFILSFFFYYKDQYEYRNAVEESSNSVVRVTTLNGRGGGTGFIADTIKGPMVISNRHVCDGEGEFKRIETQSGQTIIGKIYKIDYDADLCAVGPLKYFGDALTIADRPAKKYERIYSTGYPFLENLVVVEGRSLETQPVNVGENVKSSKECFDKHGLFIDDPWYGLVCVYTMTVTNTSMHIFPGCSGSPVLNARGEVVGVIAVGNNATNYGGYVPLPYLQKFLEQL